MPDDPNEGLSYENSQVSPPHDAPFNTAIGRAQAHSGQFDEIDMGRHNLPLRVTNPSPAPSQYEYPLQPVMYPQTTPPAQAPFIPIDHQRPNFPIPLGQNRKVLSLMLPAIDLNSQVRG